MLFAGKRGGWGGDVLGKGEGVYRMGGGGEGAVETWEEDATLLDGYISFALTPLRTERRACERKAAVASRLENRYLLSSPAFLYEMLPLAVQTRCKCALGTYENTHTHLE